MHFSSAFAGRGKRSSEVDPNGPAAERGVKAGDVIMSVGGKAATNPRDAQNEITQSRQAGKHSVLMRVKSGDTVYYLALPLATS